MSPLDCTYLCVFVFSQMTFVDFENLFVDLWIFGGISWVGVVTWSLCLISTGPLQKLEESALCKRCEKPMQEGGGQRRGRPTGKASVAVERM